MVYNSKPNLEEVKRVMDENFTKDQFSFPESRVEFSNVEKPSKQEKKSIIISIGVTQNSFL